MPRVLKNKNVDGRINAQVTGETRDIIAGCVDMINDTKLFGRSHIGQVIDIVMQNGGEDIVKDFIKKTR